MSFNDSAYDISLMITETVGSLLLPGLGLELGQYLFLQQHPRIINGLDDGGDHARYAECASSYESTNPNPGRICLYTSCGALLNEMCDFEKKNVASLYEQLLRDETLDVEIGRDIGWSAVRSFHERLLLVDDDSSDAAVAAAGRIEVGGGLGLGFQLYCGGRLLLTSGLGGGGGYEGRVGSSNADDSGDSSSYGGGGGMGVQFLLNETWYSLGGGGGCGASPGNDTTVACGTSLDSSSEAAAASFSAFRFFKTELASTCSRGAVLLGGGGAGGGTASCCERAQVGYGFFFYSSSANTADEVVGSNGGGSSDGGSYDYSGSDSPQFAYDTSGELLREASTHCSGRFANWSCVCLGARDVLERCASNSSSSSHCGDYSNRFDRVSWLLQASCSSYGGGSSARVYSRPLLQAAAGGGGTVFLCLDPDDPGSSLKITAPQRPSHPSSDSSLLANFAVTLFLLVLVQALLLQRRVRFSGGKRSIGIVHHAYSYESL